MSMSDPRNGIKCGHGLYVHDVNGGNAEIIGYGGVVKIERADIADVIKALQSVLDWSPAQEIKGEP